MSDTDKLKSLCERLRVQRDDAIRVAERATNRAEILQARIAELEAALPRASRQGGAVI